MMKKIDLCLLNDPTSKSNGSCGNGILDSGEECDCGKGPSEACFPSCCNAETCRLKGGAKCASGACCDEATCKPKKCGTECRSIVSQCDRAEFCDGEKGACPEDVYKEDGHSCENSLVCFGGECVPSCDEQCRALFGSGARAAPDVCFGENTRGGNYGDCRYDPYEITNVECRHEHKRCGRLQCETDGRKNSIFIFENYTTTNHTNASERTCSHVIAHYPTNVPGIHNRPGMTRDGTPCGDGRFCKQAKCIKAVDSAFNPMHCPEKHDVTLTVWLVSASLALCFLLVALPLIIYGVVRRQFLPSVIWQRLKGRGKGELNHPAKTPLEPAKTPLQPAKTPLQPAKTPLQPARTPRATPKNTAI